MTQSEDRVKDLQLFLIIGNEVIGRGLKEKLTGGYVGEVIKRGSTELYLDSGLEIDFEKYEDYEVI